MQWVVLKGTQYYRIICGVLGGYTDVLDTYGGAGIESVILLKLLEGYMAHWHFFYLVWKAM